MLAITFFFLLFYIHNLMTFSFYVLFCRTMNSFTPHVIQIKNPTNTNKKTLILSPNTSKLIVSWDFVNASLVINQFISIPLLYTYTRICSNHIKQKVIKVNVICYPIVIMFQKGEEPNCFDFNLRHLLIMDLIQRPRRIIIIEVSPLKCIIIITYLCKRKEA